MGDATYILMREVGSGIISLMLIVLTLTLVHYLYRNWRETEIEDVSARNIAIGLSLFFGAVAFRSTELWIMLIMTRHRIPIPENVANTFQSFPVYLIILAAVVTGAICTVRALNPGPIWTILVAVCVVIPIIVVFL